MKPRSSSVPTEERPRQEARSLAPTTGHVPLVDIPAGTSKGPSQGWAHSPLLRQQYARGNQLSAGSASSRPGFWLCPPGSVHRLLPLKQAGRKKSRRTGEEPKAGRIGPTRPSRSPSRLCSAARQFLQNHRLQTSSWEGHSQSGRWVLRSG